MITVCWTEFHITYMAELSATTKNETLMITVCWTEFHITYMAELSATTKIETLMITVCWTEFHIKNYEREVLIVSYLRINKKNSHSKTE